MWKLLREPYPIEKPGRRRWATAFWIGVFVGVFLLIFQPFGLSEWHTSQKTLKVLGFGLITFIITLLHHVVVPVLFPEQFREERWTVGRAIVWMSINILLIGLANYLYVLWLVGNRPSSSGVLVMVLFTFLIGLFPSAGIVVLNYIVKLRKYEESAAQLPIHEPPAIPETPANPAFLTLTAENGKDTLTLPVADLLYVESSDNYATVVYQQADQTLKSLLRSSLSRLESQIDTDPDLRERIVRCHRSYLVNLAQVEKVSGNAQGYKLHLFDHDFPIPVARKYNDTLIQQLKTLP